MASLSFVHHKPPSDATSDIELDLTPMMSMFLILLPFLVSMAVLTHLTILEFSLPPNVGAGSGGISLTEKPRLKLTLVITPRYLLATYGERMLDSLAVIENQYDFLKIDTLMTRCKKELNCSNELIVASNDHVPLKNIVALMDRCKAAGFDKIGLSGATSDPREGK
jgi:biopolymer transport protein ExbD